MLWLLDCQLHQYLGNSHLPVMDIKKVFLLIINIKILILVVRRGTGVA